MLLAHLLALVAHSTGILLTKVVITSELLDLHCTDAQPTAINPVVIAIGLRLSDLGTAILYKDAVIRDEILALFEEELLVLVLEILLQVLLADDGDVQEQRILIVQHIWLDFLNSSILYLRLLLLPLLEIRKYILDIHTMFLNGEE